MKPSPYQIAAFTEVARARSFSRAASALGVTQSSVTQHIGKLERLMGALLFIRRRDGLELTLTGRDLFAVTDRLRALEQLVEEKIASYSDLSSGHLTIIANAPRPAMPIIAEFTRRYPNVQIVFALYDWTTAMGKLRDREVDIAVITEPEILDGSDLIELARTPYLAHMRVDHPLASSDDISLADLAETHVILPEDGSFTQRTVRDKTALHGISLKRIIKTTSFPVVKEAVLHGVGIGLLLENSMFPSANLATVPVREMPEAHRHCLVTPRDKGDLRLIQSFADIARGE